MNILQRWKQTTIANKGLVFSSFLMAVGTLFYAGAAVVQVWIMKQSARDNSAQTDKIIKAAQNQACAAKSFASTAALINGNINNAVGKLEAQAKATQAASDIARESLISVQKAMVDTGTMMAVPLPDSSGKKASEWQFFIPWENNGTTPTKDARTYSGWSLDEPTDLTFSQSRKSKFTPVTIGPKGVVTSSEMDISLETIQAIKNDAGQPQPRPIRLFFWGWIRYNDIFKGTVPHLTEVCRELTGMSGPATGETQFQMVFTLCEHHNCADEECEDYRAISQHLK